ncbi:hypothetical protein OV203_11280 [Nannocystis sp. ILAH1]|uniref:hypothetical protein n=1 Tax=Nannocystis sp. ILAH1 TaxID=2996789 RepID=UPI00226FB3E0|nr:hypothetical protein [Nannocystis sp. ILAH1]MCY0987710.1 hypothetical protein [Nannocystis sp. ILAH1]
MTFKIKGTDGVRRMAVSRFFVLRTLAWSRRGDFAICRALKPLLAPLSLHEQGEYLLDLQNVDKFIARTRITAIENYIDWENIDHDAALEKMIAAMKLPTSYHLEVFFSDPAHLARIKVGDQLKSEQVDGWLKADPGNIYTFKRDDEHWYLHKLLATYNESGENVIAWTNAHDSVLDRTNGILPWREGDRWGAVDRDGAMCVRFMYEDVDFQNGGLVFKRDDRWIAVADAQRDGRPDPAASSAFSDSERQVEARADLDVGLLRQKTGDPAAVTRASEDLRAAQVDTYGLTLAQLLRCWIRVFSMRPDIHVLHDNVGSPVSAAALAALASRLPAHAHALAAEAGPMHFGWVFKDMLAEVGSSGAGNHGGRLNLLGFEAFRWHASDADEFVAMFDDLQAEGSTFLIQEPGTSSDRAEVVFVDRGERRSFGTVAHYITRGAESAFVWYWPKRGYWEAEGLVARLAAASLPRSTPADEVVAGLCARGLSRLEAQAVQRWLGADAVLLLHA